MSDDDRTIYQTELDKGGESVDILAGAALAFIHDLEAKIKQLENPWVDVNERPAPKDKTILLSFEEGQTSVGYWDENGDGDGIEAWVEPISGEPLDLNYDPPTHWMSLPSTPDTDKE